MLKFTPIKFKFQLLIKTLKLQRNFNTIFLLAERQEYARRSKATEEAMRERLIVTKAIVEEEKVNKKDISFDLTRQYKTLQLQSETKILALEETIKKLTSELQTTKQSLTEVTRQRDKLKEEKEVEVAALNNQLSFLKKSYETIIQVTK